LKKLFSFLRFIILYLHRDNPFLAGLKDIPMKEMWQGIKNANYFWIILLIYRLARTLQPWQTLESSHKTSGV
jgi:mRNA-degrading endonuclease YafQ of YafQ-DinJ toxin-antitoxin module